MASLPVEVLYGIYLGVLLGVIPALVSWALGFIFKYLTNVTVPGLGVAVLAVAIAGANGGLLALNDPTLTASENQVRLTIALLIVLMLSLYAHNRGDHLGASTPRRLNLRKLTERTLSTDVVELVGGRGQVHISVTGEVGDMEGYPPVPATLRATIRESTWTFPADVPLVELESRLADRLRTEHDLADVNVTLDERGRATIIAAPPTGTLSKRISTGKRAVSIEALVPTGLAADDDVLVVSGADRIEGTVVSLRTDRGGTAEGVTDGGAATDGGETPKTEATPVAAPTATGGRGRLTVSVDRVDIGRLLGADVDRVVVRSRGTRREFELVSLLRRAGHRFERVTVREGGALDGVTLGTASVRDTYEVAVMAVRHDGEWVLAPRGSQAVDAGDDLYVVGKRDALGTFKEVAV